MRKTCAQIVYRPRTTWVQMTYLYTEFFVSHTGGVRNTTVIRFLYAEIPPTLSTTLSTFFTLLRSHLSPLSTPLITTTTIYIK